MGVSFRKWLAVCLPVLMLASSLSAKIYTATRELKIRSAKNTSSAVIGTIDSNATVEVSQTDDIWWTVQFDEKEGYVLGKYLKEVAESATIATDDTPSDLPSITGRQKIIGAGILVVLLIVITQVKKFLYQRKARNSKNQLIQKDPTELYWHQCLNCHSLVKKNVAPNTNGCFMATQHEWMNLGETGKLKFICTNCSTTLMVKSDPATGGCPKAEAHQWKQF